MSGSAATGSALAAMNEAQKRIGLIAGNLANVETGGYKGFDVVYSSINNSAGQGSSGVTSRIRTNLDLAGSRIGTGIATDIRIDGSGMVPVAQLDSSGAIQATYFTREGSFRKDNLGQFVTSAGYAMVAWPLDTNGNLPDTKSLLSSLQVVNVRQLISEASATSAVDFTISLSSDQKAVGGGITTLDISQSASSSPYNSNIDADTLLYPNPTNSLTKGEGVQIQLNGSPQIITFDGFAESTTFDNTGTDLVGTSTDTITVTIGGVVWTIPRGDGTSNLAVLNHIVRYIEDNASTTDQSLRARLVNDGTNSTLYLAPSNINLGMSFGGNAAFRTAIGYTDSKNRSPFVQVKDSAYVGRFASLADLTKTLTAISMPSTVASQDGIGAVVTITSSQPAFITNYQPLNKGSDFLTEFGISSGYLKSSYNPYDSNNNMAGKHYSAHFTQNFDVVNSKGKSEPFIIAFLRTDTDTWATEVYAVNPLSVDAAGRVDGLVAAGIVRFDGSGNLLSVEGTTQSASSKNFTDITTKLGATKGQTLTVQVNNTTHTFNYGPSSLTTPTIAEADGKLIASTSGHSAGDLFKVTVGSTVKYFNRGSGTSNEEVLKNLEQQINLTSGTDALHATLSKDTADNYKLNIKALNAASAVSYSQPTATSQVSGGALSTGTSYAAISGTLNVSDGTNTYNITDLSTFIGANDAATLANIVADINSNAAANFTASTYTDPISLKSYLLVEPNDTTKALTFTFGDAPTATALGLKTVKPLAAELGLVSFKSIPFTANGTDLPASGTVEFKVNSGTATYAMGTGATNKLKLETLVDNINASTTLKAQLLTDGATGNVYVDVVPVTTSDSVYVSGGSAGAALNFKVGNYIAVNSFSSLTELNEQVNSTSGADGITADILTGTTSGAYRLVITPSSRGANMYFGGSNANIASPLGVGLADTISHALELVDTPAQNQIASLDETITVNWAPTVGAIASTLALNIGTVGLKNGLSEASGNSFTTTASGNGISAGNLSSINIDQYGYLIANFTNGAARSIYKLAVADFANTEGLTPFQSNVYTVSNSSGPVNLKEAGAQGAGKIDSGALEESNVVMSQEIINMITAQQTYQANAKVLNIDNELQSFLINKIAT